MYRSLLTLGIAAVACALPNGFDYTSHTSGCREVQIPVQVSVPRFILNTTIENDWDATALTLALTRRDSGTSSDPLPVAGSTSKAVKSSYTIGATLCGTGRTTLVLTHGIIESKKYWDPDFLGGDKYSFVKAALAAGYSVLSYDRIGVGTSSKVNSSTDAQFQVQGAVLDELVSYARKTMKAEKVALFGHSYGSYISALSASQTEVDALILTGYSGSFANFAPFVAGTGFRIARLQQPYRWGDLDSGYITSSDLFAETYVYFAAPHFSHDVAEWTYNVASQPFAIGELPTVLETTIDYSKIKAPVLLLQGQFDVSACGGDCVGLINTTATLFNNSKRVQYVDDLPAGHDLNLHYIAPKAFQMVFDFLKKERV
ncbi:alpha/beta-hydrolase [Rhizodiscina lignyota]|uniref:Alpha/beta-hydrolase n=1 Tax=Rhizodiscina lignyota TaxID=1504668 RepID=A0A9P4I3T6_9PEZI|nr:alpha/beta-hydrolase [Rhizodiscina lignyota]